MAQAGDSYAITLKKTHLKWGEHRYTNSRGTVYGEGYIPIPARYARKYQIVNKNGTPSGDTLGLNLFNCKSADGYYEGIIRAQGNTRAGYIYAKQFAGDKNLKALGDWFYKVSASVGDKVLVEWTSATDIITKI